MPTYLYECPVHGQFEEVHRMSDRVDDCPSCEKIELKTPVRRLINFGSAIRVEPGKHEIKEKIDKEITDFKKEYEKNEYLRANVMGEGKYQEKVSNSEKAVKDLGRVGRIVKNSFWR